MDKHSLRRQFREKRASLTQDERGRFSQDAAGHLFSGPLVAKAATIGLFASVRTEINTRPLFEMAKAGGITVCFPKMCDDTRLLRWGVVDAWESMTPGLMGISQPIDVSHEVDDIDLIVVPGLGFGMNGGRLGYGAGWYDRSLVSFQGTVVGLGFECQVVDEVPIEDHDHRVHWIVTELRAISLKE